MRYTKKNAIAAFKRLAETCGRTIGGESGQWGLEINTYFGYRIVQYMENGGESHPFQEGCLPCGEFCRACHAAANVIEWCGFAPG